MSYTKIDNKIFDLLSRLSGAELKILLVIIRKTTGWNKQRDWISHSQFMIVTGLSRRSITSSITTLIEKQCIRVTNSQGNSLNVDERKRASKLYYTLCNNCMGSQNTHAKSSREPVQKLPTTKNKQQKSRVQKISDQERLIEILSSLPLS